MPEKKQIHAVFFLPKEADLASSADLLLSFLPPPVELLGAADTVADLPKFTGLKFALSLLEGITAQKLAQRLTSAKHVDTLSVPTEPCLIKTTVEGVWNVADPRGSVEKWKKGLPDVDFVVDSPSAAPEKVSTIVKSTAKKVGGEQTVRV